MLELRDCICDASHLRVECCAKNAGMESPRVRFDHIKGSIHQKNGGMFQFLNIVLDRRLLGRGWRTIFVAEFVRIQAIVTRHPISYEIGYVDPTLAGWQTGPC